MIPLHGRAQAVELAAPLQRRVWVIVDARTATRPREGRAFLITPGDDVPTGFDLYLAKSSVPDSQAASSVIELPDRLHHLTAGDIISVGPTGQHIRVMWRHRSKQNSVLLTERCDNYCLMCSQPPKERNDDWLLDDAFELVRLLPRTTDAIGFTGGEPTLYGDAFVRLMLLVRNLLPFAGVHILSNGRRFSSWDFATAYAEIENPRQMVGIPIYGAEPALHDYVVQASGAFEETIVGLLNLARLAQRIELRVVVHQQTAPHLAEIAEFIARNLPFVEQVALMGLEPTGFARANMREIWIDPYDYRVDLLEAVRRLDRRRIKTLVYNHPLCLLERELWPFAVRSISDWKNELHPECEQCAAVDACAGFFHSAKHRVSDHVRALSPSEVAEVRDVLPV